VDFIYHVLRSYYQLLRRFRCVITGRNCIITGSNCTVDLLEALMRAPKYFEMPLQPVNQDAMKSCLVLLSIPQVSLDELMQFSTNQHDKIKRGTGM